MTESSVYQAFDQTGAKLYTFSCPNEYILLIEADRLKKWDYIFRQLAQEHQGSLKIGIGSSDTLNRQNLSYQAARIAVASLSNGQNLAIFDHMHKNTLQYQLDRIWRSCGYNPRSFQDAVILYMGMKWLL